MNGEVKAKANLEGAGAAAVGGRWWYEGGGGRMILHCLDRHDVFVDGLFLDLSVRELELKSLWTLTWNRQSDTADCWTKASSVTAEDKPRWMWDFREY